jgi:hypothetical protein
MIQILNTKVLLVIALLLSSVASYAAYRWRQDVAQEERVKDFYAQMEQKRKQDQAISKATEGWADSIRKHRTK